MNLKILLQVMGKCERKLDSLTLVGELESEKEHSEFSQIYTS